LCIGETDGYLGSADLDLLLPVDAVRRQAALEWLLASRGKFRLVPHTRDGGGWRIPNWTEHNSTVATVDKHRKKWREDKKRQRAQARAHARDDQMSTGGLHPGSKDKDKGFAVRESNHSGTVTVDPNHDSRVTS
jgi:hypothetical protein